MTSDFRRPIFLNKSVKSLNTPSATSSDIASAFHKRLPNYAPTRLVCLDRVAEEIGVKAVFLKDESKRLGLPSFKILGASWGTFRAVAGKVGLPLDSDITVVKAAVSGLSTTLYAATDGNHGRAVAWMGNIIGMHVHIFVPSGMHASTVQLIKDEGAQVTKVTGSYDLAVQVAFDTAKENGGILVQDTAFPGYEEIPRWIVEGYSTMMREVDEQLGQQNADLVVAPVGVGSFAQAVVSHYKASGRSSRILTVEPDTAGCLYKSLVKGQPVIIETTHTIMAGLECGTVSSIAWPLLHAGVDASLTVSDYEAHQARDLLHELGISAGPCGAAPLAALRRLAASDKADLGLDASSVVVLLCTEGNREYPTPRDVSFGEAQRLAKALVQINSVNPGTGNIPGPGECEIAQYISAWLEHRDIETHWLESTPGRPTVVGVVRGTGEGKSLMFNGHIDTVTTAGYDGDPLEGRVRNGKLYGRGAADMKGGVAAAMVALAQAKKSPLHGDLIFAGVADEENLSIGTEELLEAGWRADGAVVCEPSLEDLVIAHKGFVWFEVVIHGVASHGSRFDLGVDAIARAGYFLTELDKYAKRLITTPQHSSLGTGSLHTSIIKGGEEPASYPARCTITLERRTVPGETLDQLKQEVEDLLKAAAQNVPGFSYDINVTFSRNAFEISQDHPFVSLMADQIKSVTGREPKIRTEAFWTDCALLADKGIPVVMYGPIGDGLHAKDEWLDVQSLDAVATVLVAVSQAFCV